MFSFVIRNQFKFIFGILFLVSGFYSRLPHLNAAYNHFPLPKALIGYRTWHQHQSRFKIIPPKKISEADRPYHHKNVVTLKFSSSQASEIKVSRLPSFENSTWLPFTNNLPWTLDLNEEEEKLQKNLLNNPNYKTPLKSIFVVFKTYDPTTQKYYISPILHDTIDVEHPEKKIVRLPNGYMDWSEMVLTIKSKASKKPNVGTPNYNINPLQKEAERQSKVLTYNALKNIPIYHRYLVGNSLSISPNKQKNLNYFLDSLKLHRVYNLSLNQITVEKRLAFTQTMPTRFNLKSPRALLSLYQLFQPEPTIPRNTIQQISKQLYDNSNNPKKYKETNRLNDEDTLSALVIDAQGLHLEPSLFIKLANKKNQVFFNSAYLKDNRATFVKYYRDFNTQEFPKNTLVASAYSLSPSKDIIILNDRYVNALLKDKRSLNRIAQGNFYILID